MPNFNQLILIGNLTRDPELRYTKNGTAVGNGGVAVNEKWTDDAGQKQERVCFMDFTAWKKSAEALAKYTSKGSAVMLCGRLTMDTYAKDDEKRTKHFLTFETFQFLDHKPSEEKSHAQN